MFFLNTEENVQGLVGGFTGGRLHRWEGSGGAVDKYYDEVRAVVQVSLIERAHFTFKLI